MAIDPQAIRDIPKVELHVHLEGTLGADRLIELSRNTKTPPPVPLVEPFEFSGLSQFLDFLDWSCAQISTQEDVARVAYDFGVRASNDGTVYAEVIVNPSHWHGLPLPDLIEAIHLGFERAQSDGLADCRILMSLLRSQDAAQAESMVQWMASSRPARVVGLSVDGNEASSGRTSSRFIRAYQMAAEAGLGLTAHAGESSGPEGVSDALNLLRVSRIDHGVRAIEDPSVVARLVDHQVTLNVCPVSNGVLLFLNLSDHPLPRLVEAGIPVTINTDDPVLVNTNLVNDMSIAATLCDWDLADLTQVTFRAIDAAFCDSVRKTQLRSLVNSVGWAE